MLSIRHARAQVLVPIPQAQAHYSPSTYMLGFFAVDFATHDLRITFGEGSFFMCFGIRGFEALSFCAFS